MPSPIPGTNGAFETRPREALKPKTPQHDAGIRIEPPPSEPCAIAQSPAASAAAGAAARAACVPGQVPGRAARAVERGVRERGRPELRRVRLARGSRSRPPSAGVTWAMSKSGTLSANACEENVVRIPAVVSRSLSEIGTPWKGASAGSSAFARASASASSPRTVTYEPSSGSRRVDPLQVGLDELDRRDLSFPNEASLLGRREERELHPGDRIRRLLRSSRRCPGGSGTSEVEEERGRGEPHERVDLLAATLRGADDDEGDEAHADAVRDRERERHEHDRQRRSPGRSRGREVDPGELAPGRRRPRPLLGLGQHRHHHEARR